MKKSFYFYSLLVMFLSSFLFVTGNVAEAAELKTINYTVQAGDTLYSVSQKFQVIKQEITDVNPELQTNSTLYAGQIIKIPDLAYEKSLEKEVVRLTNVERAKVGLSALTYDWELSGVARYKSKDMRDLSYISHYSPTYGDPFIMMKDFGISFTKAGENVAAKQDTPEKVVSNFMGSESHRDNILNPGFTRIGVGYAQGGLLTHWWTQLFITP